uniref:Uncharacterized protein n=1 Tax=Zea mays TaxID=4577 RepID=C0PNA3_MAIZE|nr:unknown [Zea mays]
MQTAALVRGHLFHHHLLLLLLVICTRTRTSLGSRREHAAERAEQVLVRAVEGHVHLPPDGHPFHLHLHVPAAAAAPARALHRRPPHQQPLRLPALHTHTHTADFNLITYSPTTRRQDLGVRTREVQTVTTAAHSLGVWVMLADAVAVTAAASVAVVVVAQEERKRGLVGGPERLAEHPLRPARTRLAAEETGGERLAVPGRQREPELQLHPVTSPYLVSFSGSASSARAALISYAAWSPRS